MAEHLGITSTTSPRPCPEGPDQPKLVAELRPAIPLGCFGATERYRRRGRLVEACAQERANVRVGAGLFTVVFQAIFGALLRGGLYLRDPRVRTLIPLRS